MKTIHFGKSLASLLASFLIAIYSEVPAQGLYSAEHTSTNSSFNTAVTAMILAGQREKVTKLEADRSFGEHLSRELTAVELARVLTVQGLEVSSKEGISLDEALSVLSSHGVLIVQTSSSNGIEYTLLQQEGGNFFYYKYPVLGRRMPFPSLLRTLTRSEGLSALWFRGVSQTQSGSESTKAEKPKRADKYIDNLGKLSEGLALKAPKVLNLGNLARNADHVLGKVKFENIGNDPITLGEVSGTCSCFEGAEYVRSIPSRGSVEMHLIFNPAKFSMYDRFTTTVAVRTSDPKLPIAAIDVIGVFNDDNYMMLQLGKEDLGAMTHAELDKKSIVARMYKLEKSQRIPAIRGIKAWPNTVQVEQLETGTPTPAVQGLSLLKSFLVKPMLPKEAKGQQTINLVILTDDPLYQQVSASVKVTVIAE